MTPSMGGVMCLTSQQLPVVVCDGDTICCSCSRSKAASGLCHRVWAAELLQLAGWCVVLDGFELEAWARPTSYGRQDDLEFGRFSNEHTRLWVSPGSGAW